MKQFPGSALTALVGTLFLQTAHGAPITQSFTIVSFSVMLIFSGSTDAATMLLGRLRGQEAMEEESFKRDAAFDATNSKSSTKNDRDTVTLKIDPFDRGSVRSFINGNLASFEKNMDSNAAAATAVIETAGLRRQLREHKIYESRRSLQDDDCGGRGRCTNGASCVGDVCFCSDGWLPDPTVEASIAGWRSCIHHNECESGLNYPCAALENSFCVDMAPPYRYKCGCLLGFTAVLPESNATFTEPVPLEYRPIRCEVPVPTVAPVTASPVLVPATAAPTDTSASMAPITAAPTSTVTNAPISASPTTASPTNAPTTAHPSDHPTSLGPTTSAPSLADTCNRFCNPVKEQCLADGEIKGGKLLCTCNQGYERGTNGDSCQPIPYCISSNNVCPSPGTFCQQHDGGFECLCLPGHVGGPNSEVGCLLTPAPSTVTPSSVPSKSPSISHAPSATPSTPTTAAPNGDPTPVPSTTT